jgi:ATP-dependent exoDNAse (exonuclease V) alpha subunit
MDYSNGVWRYDAFRFGTGDNVINIVNKYGQDNDDNIFLQVANGEIGTVMHAIGTKVTVQFPTNLVEFDIQEEKTLRPAYALTVHKSQGSEYANVIVKCKFTFGDNRKRFYTAITRAQQKCIVFEVGNDIARCIRATSSMRLTKLMQ